MSDLIKIINRKPEITDNHMLHWMSAGDKFFTDKRKNTLIELERIIDHQDNSETMRITLHLLNANRKTFFRCDETIYWACTKITPLALHYINGKPQRMLFCIEQRETLIDLVKNNT